MLHLPGPRHAFEETATHPAAFRPVLSPLHHTKGLTLREASIVQVDRGPANFRSLHVTGKETVLTMLRSDRRTAGNVVVDPFYTVVLVPVYWTGDYLFDGHEAEPGDAFLSDQWNGHHSSRAQYCGLTVGLPCASLIQAVRDLTGRKDEMVDLSGGLLATAATGGLAFRNNILQIVRRSIERSRTPGHSSISRFEETDVLNLTARLIASNRVGNVSSTTSSTNAALVSRALEDLDFFTGNVSIGELCRAANCGETKLHEAFVEVLGVSPGLFLKRLRFEKARSLLADPASPHVAVKQVVYSLGIKNGGRFAAQYKHVFDMSPKETLMLRRSHVI